MSRKYAAIRASTSNVRQQGYTSLFLRPRPAMIKGTRTLFLGQCQLGGFDFGSAVRFLCRRTMTRKFVTVNKGTVNMPAKRSAQPVLSVYNM